MRTSMCKLTGRQTEAISMTETTPKIHPPDIVTVRVFMITGTDVSDIQVTSSTIAECLVLTLHNHFAQATKQF